LLLEPPFCSKLCHSSSRRSGGGSIANGGTKVIRKQKIKSKNSEFYKMKIARKLGVAAIGLVTIASLSLPAAAQTSSDLQAQITALLAQIAALQAQLGTSTATTSTTYNFTRDLTLGSTGEDVKALQQYLNAAGYTVAATGAGSVGNESTYFGSLTQAALAKFQAANGISPAAGYFGPITRAKIASMTPTTPTTPVTPSSPLTVSLAADNPASANVQKGSANNPVLKLMLTSGSSAVTVTGLTLKSYGTTEATGTTDVSAVKLFDENNIQLGNTRTPTGNQVNFVIVPALTIPANSSRTVTVTANIGNTTNVMAAVRYGIESASAILGGTTFTGSYPVVGNSFTIVPAGQLGSASVSKYGSLPKTSVKIGETDVVLQRFNVSAGSNEDIQINQITLSGNATNHTASDSDVTNIRLRQVGSTTVLAGPASMSNKKVTFNLSSPISLTKGSSMNLEVVGNIVEGNSRKVALEIALGGVVSRGLTSGTNVTSSGSFTETTGVTIGNETLTVSMSASHPQGANAFIIKTTNRKDLAKFDVRANGGDVILNNINVTITGLTSAPGAAAGTVSSVGIYDGDSLVSDLQNMTFTAGTKTQNFSLNYTIPANTTKTLTVKGVTNDITFTGLTYVQLTTTLKYTDATTPAIGGYGLASGAVVSQASDVAATAVTVYPAGTVTPSADTTKTPYSQAVLGPSNNVTIAALKVYAQREDMKLTDMVITVSGTNYDNEHDISSITLYADDGVTALTNPIAYGASAGGATTDTFTIGASDILNDVVFAKNSYKTVLVKANFASPTGTDTGTNMVYATAVSAKIVDGTDGQLVLRGQDSGTPYDVNAGITSDVSFVISSPYAGGTFSINPYVATLQKASTSPSGVVARGTQTVTGVWDVNNFSSTQNALRLTAVTFTSKTGLPTSVNTKTTLFKLYDGDGNTVAASAATVTSATGKVAFTGLTFDLNPGEPKQLKLVVDTTNTADWTSSTQLQWAIEAVTDAAVSADATGNGDFTTDGDGSTVPDDADAGAVGYAAGVWTIPATVNVVTMP
jgi:hypothetical protein